MEVSDLKTHTNLLSIIEAPTSTLALLWKGAEHSMKWDELCLWFTHLSVANKPPADVAAASPCYLQTSKSLARCLLLPTLSQNEFLSH